MPDTIEIEPIRIDTGTVKGGEVASYIEELYSLRERSKVRQEVFDIYISEKNHSLNK